MSLAISLAPAPAAGWAGQCRRLIPAHSQLRELVSTGSGQNLGKGSAEPARLDALSRMRQLRLAQADPRQGHHRGQVHTGGRLSGRLRCPTSIDHPNKKLG